MAASAKTGVRAKQKFHHGDLKQALIDAARLLLAERGADGFSLSDACRLAGVSTAAPYKHFRDKDEILGEVVKQGFDALRGSIDEAIEKAGPGTLEAMIAMGLAYLAFARAQSATFRLMFGQSSSVKLVPGVAACGGECFAGVIGHVETYCKKHRMSVNAKELALDLWTFVHGAASLDIDSDYAKVAPGLDVDALLARATPRLLATAPAKRPRPG